MESALAVRRNWIALLPGVLFVAVLSVGFAGEAEARTATLTWSQPEADRVTGFRFYWGNAKGAYTQWVDVPRPAPNSNGKFQTTLQLPDTQVHLAATAYDANGIQSLFSNEKVFAALNAPPPTEPPPTEPPPTEPPPTEPPPVPTGDTSWDFEGLPQGAFVPGWVDTESPDRLTTDDSLFALTSIGGNEMLTTSSDDLNIHSHFVDGLGGWSDYALRGRMQFSDPQGSVGVTAYSEYPTADVYYKLFRIGTAPEDDFWIVTHPEISCSDPRTNVVPVANAWYEFRLEVTSQSASNTIRAKVWRSGTSEPSAWQATCVDNRGDRPSGGTIGLWSRGAGAKYWDDLEVLPVDPGSVPPPPPVEELGVPGRPTLIW